MSETALKQLEGIGFWMAGAATAIDEWKTESDDVRHMLHGLVDDYLDNGGELSSALTSGSIDQVWDDMAKEARESDLYPHAVKEGQSE